MVLYGSSSGATNFIHWGVRCFAARNRRIRRVLVTIMHHERLPVSVLENNIIYEFERRAAASSYCLNHDVKNGKVAPELNVLIDRHRPLGPFADLDSREISLYESHLAFLWAFIYSSFVIYEEGVQKPLLEGSFEGKINFEDPLMRRALELQKWAIQFAHSFSEWDRSSLPNPDHVYENERFYVERVNNIFLQAVSFLIFHEYGHLVLNHDANAGSEWILEQEKDAETFAASFFVDEQSTEKERRVLGVSIVLLYASNIFLPERISGLWQINHPHLHDRIRNGIGFLNLQDDESKFYIYYLATISLQTYLSTKDVHFEKRELETAEDLFFEYLDRIDNLHGSGLWHT